ncbi:MAG: HD domain-containing protein [Candidatus Kapabacteria bacterium]|jgi:guanosine-3',5'-bis(diphosphate) 3'-pyrophosphohydrolase|nr:HD domain-containing protein [Candidatus Kapabacteria bacterium]
MGLKNINIEQEDFLPLEKSNPYGKDKHEDLNALLTQATKSIVKPDIELLTRGFYYCVDKHSHVKRKSGEPYYTHPLKVAISLMRDFNVGDTNAVIAALLHDTVEDIKGLKIYHIEEEFGKDVATMVDAVTKISGTETRQGDKAATYGKMFLALVRDVRVILIKLADRLDNMRTLYYLKPEKQKAIAHETLNFYTPFAQRLGLTKVRTDFEDLSLYFIDRKAFESINDALVSKRKSFLEYIKNFFIKITNKLNERNVEHVLTFEHKHIYEIYRMIEEGHSVNDIDNFYSIVISLKTNDYSQAYRAYGIIAHVFGPVSSLVDYIARPRINLYRALHSTHMGPGRKLVEVIIRTDEMDRIIERGIYDFTKIEPDTRPLALSEEDVVSWVKWMQLIISEGDDDAVQKIWGTIRRNLYVDDITIHIKDDESYLLPKGACLVDLAFAISENTGMTCISAKVNNEIKTLDYELTNNDYVEIITSPNSKPNPNWEDFVITHKAVVKLYDYFRFHGNDTERRKGKKDDVNFNLLVKAEERKGLLEEIRTHIGKQNIRSLSLYTSGTIFEALLRLSFENSEAASSIFTKLSAIKGLTGIERVD